MAEGVQVNVILTDKVRLEDRLHSPPALNPLTFRLQFREVACPPKVVPSVKLVVVQTARKREYDT